MLHSFDTLHYLFFFLILMCYFMTLLILSTLSLVMTFSYKSYPKFTSQINNQRCSCLHLLFQSFATKPKNIWKRDRDVSDLDMFHTIVSNQRLWQSIWTDNLILCSLSVLAHLHLHSAKSAIPKKKIEDKNPHYCINSSILLYVHRHHHPSTAKKIIKQW